MIKMISLVYKRPELRDEDFRHYWSEKHGPLAARIVPGLRKYVQNHPIKKPGSDHDCDGIAEIWFDDLAAFERFIAWRGTSEGKELLDDEDKFVDKSRTVRYVVEERGIA